MHREAEATGQPADPRRLDPLMLTMDLATQVQGISGAFFAAQAGAAQDAMDRLVAHGRRLTEARDPVSALAIHMDCCVSLLEVVSARFGAALKDLPYPRAAIITGAPELGASTARNSVERPADSHALRRPSHAADAAGASGDRKPGEHQE
jgi:hypothetical protein